MQMHCRLERRADSSNPCLGCSVCAEYSKLSTPSYRRRTLNKKDLSLSWFSPVSRWQRHADQALSPRSRWQRHTYIGILFQYFGRFQVFASFLITSCRKKAKFSSTGTLRMAVQFDFVLFLKPIWSFLACRCGKQTTWNQAPYVCLAIRPIKP